MNEVYEKYVCMLKRFLNHELPVEAYRAQFFALFQNETAELDESLYLLLDELYGDLDSYTDLPELLADDAKFYLDEVGLRLKAADMLAQLESWNVQRKVA